MGAQFPRGCAVKRILLIIAGYASLFFGIVGIFIPLLPTTPFLLLAAACFFRSSKPLYRWITHHAIFGNYIRSYMLFGAVSAKTKIIALVFLWISIGYLSLYIITIIWVRILLIAIAAGVTIHLVRLRTLTKAMIDEMERMRIAEHHDSSTSHTEWKAK